MIIVVEGPNNVGKTTFINKLLRVLPEYSVDHTSQICPNTLDYYRRCLMRKKVIYDRLHIGEMIYPILRDRKPAITHDDFDKLCKIKNVLYVFVDADDEFIIQANKNKKEEYDMIESMYEREVFKKYQDNLKNKGCSVITVHNHLPGNKYEDDTPDKAITYILTECEDNDKIN